MNELFKKVDVQVPCGERIAIERGALEIGGIFNVCLSSCPKGEDMNSCSDFTKWYEADCKRQDENDSTED